MSIGFWQIIVIGISFLIIFGSGYLGIYVFKQNPGLKKYVNKKNIIIISLFYIILVSVISGNNAAFGIGAFITPWVIALINSLFRNKMIFKKIFDEKFYYFFLGVLIFGFISTTIGSFSS
tara:strand:- start:56 stop:415 length:360 start_codon:yes stop_codon:yes gene_type:complete